MSQRNHFNHLSWPVRAYPRDLPQYARSRILAESNNRCIICGEPANEVHHIVRRQEALVLFDGVLHHPDNLAATCKAHNALAEEESWLTSALGFAAKQHPAVRNWLRGRLRGSNDRIEPTVDCLSTGQSLISYQQVFPMFPNDDATEHWETYQKAARAKPLKRDLSQAMAVGTIGEHRMSQLLNAALKADATIALEQGFLESIPISPDLAVNRRRFTRVSYAAQQLKSEGIDVANLMTRLRARFGRRAGDEPERNILAAREIGPVRSLTDHVEASHRLLFNAEFASAAWMLAKLGDADNQVAAQLMRRLSSLDWWGLKDAATYWGINKILREHRPHEAIPVLTRAVGMLDLTGHPFRPSLYSTLGLAHLELYKATGDATALARALWALSAAWYLLATGGDGYREQAGLTALWYCEALWEYGEVGLLRRVQEHFVENYDRRFKFKFNRVGFGELSSLSFSGRSRTSDLEQLRAGVRDFARHKGDEYHSLLTSRFRKS